jgi:hypothetical protein
MGLRGEAQREQRSAVEAALESDHPGPLRVRARELDRVLDRLGSGVEERRLGRFRHGRELTEALGERDVRLVRDDREVGVREAAELLLRRCDDVRVRMADVEAADSAGEVYERVSVDIGDRGAARVLDDHRQEDRKRVGHHPLLPRQDLLRARARDLGPQVDCARHSHGADIN